MRLIKTITLTLVALQYTDLLHGAVSKPDMDYFQTHCLTLHETHQLFPLFIICGTMLCLLLAEISDSFLSQTHSARIELQLLKTEGFKKTCQLLTMDLVCT